MPSRRRKRRTIRPEQDEVDDLFQLLLEQAAPSTPQQWFEAPWRSGVNAIQLGAMLLGIMLPNLAHVQPICSVISLAQTVKDSAETPTPERLYWHAQHLKAVSLTQIVSVNLANEVLELIQKFAANSDGGGFGYNGPLLRMCEAHLAAGGTLDTAEPIVRRWRAQDVVGDTSHGTDATQQKRLRAFLLAWNRGLYRIAAIV